MCCYCYFNFVHAGNDKSQLLFQLIAAMESTTMFNVLNQVDYFSCEDFYLKYLHDFVRLVHKCKHKDQYHETKEYEVKR